MGPGVRSWGAAGKADAGRCSRLDCRLPDVALFTPPLERVPTRTPLLAIEIVSESERYYELLDKLYDFELWGVPHIWIISPRYRALQFFESAALRPVDKLTLPEYSFDVRYDDLVAGLPDDI
jgi:Uma2 family endonuclease